MTRYFVSIAALSVSTALPAAAQTAAAPVVATQPMTLPDPASIAVPDVTATDPEVIKEGYKFYYFYNPAVSFAEAYTDIAECRAHLAVGGALKVPGFVPWDEEHRTTAVRGAPMLLGGPSPVGIATSLAVTAVLSAIIGPKMERGVRSNKMRRCMGTRGYTRYPMPEAAWSTMNKSPENDNALIQAKLATGPKPTTDAVPEE